MFIQLSKIEEFSQVKEASFKYVNVFYFYMSEIARLIDDKDAFCKYKKVIRGPKTFRKKVKESVGGKCKYLRCEGIKIRVYEPYGSMDMTCNGLSAGMMYVYYTNYVKDKGIDIKSMIIPKIGKMLPTPDNLDAFHRMYCMAGVGIEFLPSLFFSMHGASAPEIGGTLALAGMLDWANHKRNCPNENLSLKEFLESTEHSSFKKTLIKCINNLGENLAELDEAALEYLFYALNNFMWVDVSIDLTKTEVLL